MKTIRYYLEFLVFLSLVKLVRFLGIDCASNLFAKIGKTVGPYLQVTKVAKRNLAIAFPNFSAGEINQIISEMWDNIARTAAEFPNLSSLSNDEFQQRVSLVGGEVLEMVRKSGKACIFVTGHFANWEVTTRTGFEAGLKLSIVYRKANNKLVDKQIHHLRLNPDLIQISKDREGARQIIRSFKENRCLCFLADQKLNSGVEIPFFGIGAMTATAPAKLALDYQCPIIPVQIIRKEGANFIVKVHKPLAINYDQNNSQEIYRIMCEINYIYEQWIKENPAQWFWVHKRWPKSYY